jgi:hypothetical protein
VWISAKKPTDVVSLLRDKGLQRNAFKFDLGQPWGQKLQALDAEEYERQRELAAKERADMEFVTFLGRLKPAMIGMIDLVKFAEMLPDERDTECRRLGAVDTVEFVEKVRERTYKDEDGNPVVYQEMERMTTQCTDFGNGNRVVLQEKERSSTYGTRVEHVSQVGNGSQDVEEEMNSKIVRKVTRTGGGGGW